MDVGYARVSSLDQNPQLQLDALDKAGCWPIYQEKVSGVAKQRPVRDEALRSLNAGDTLTVWKLDRLGRSISELHDIVNGLKRRGVKFRSLTESIDTSTAQGRAFFGLLAVFAEFEREMIVERTKAGKAQRAASGKHPGGHRMYGYELDRVTEIPHEADLLRAAAAHVLEGGSLARLVDAWNRDRVPTKSGKGRWSETHVRRMLVNPRAAGLFEDGTHQRLVRLFAPAAARQRLGAPATRLLSGILRCAAPKEDGRECGAPMYCGRDHGARGDLVYRCHAAGSGGRHAGCGKVSVSAAAADRWVLETIVAAVTNDEFTQALNARRAALLSGDVTAEQVDEWRAEIGELEQVLETRFAVDAHKARHDELQRLVRQATAQLLQRPDLEELMGLPRTEAALRAAWAGWDVEQRRRRIKLLMERVRVLPQGGTGRRFNHKRMVPAWRV